MQKSVFLAILLITFQPNLGTSADLLPPEIDVPIYSETENRPAQFLGEPYVGFGFGLGTLNAELTSDCGCEASTEAKSRRAGVFAGKNWNVLDNTWLGIEGDLYYNWRDISFNEAEVGTDLSGSIRARIGEQFGRAFIFTTAGFALGNGFVENPDDSELLLGWTAGFGIDWSISEATFVRAEYRYTNYNTAELSGVDVNFDQDIITVGIARRF
ncbi:outer membrane beta-barrel protein [Rhizobium sp. NFACC06-2]|uniref:outer membrane protein n=1 Tax=Rhizobium sp. NFACC06-2 TaxID=1566264 RepID=UPI000876347E|nr:outer membrane beta-barrel protein [Rhizobium sp. NFACC06-2]SCY84298.1 Outer membrane protein beta-barrel domain-containing protein [Rhizobium sp. NFACC06-2]